MALDNKVLPGFRNKWDSRFCLAADLGQSNDPTAICVMEHLKGRRIHWRGREEAIGEQFLVRYLRRLPLGTSYIDVCREIGAMLDRPPLHRDCDFVIDETGVGRPVGDLFALMRIRPTRIVITAGETQSNRATCRWHVPKAHLISALDARLHTGELQIAPELADAAVLKEELRDFRRHVSVAGRHSWEARTGRHDDLVLAVALALWNFVGRQKQTTPPAFSTHARFT